MAGMTTAEANATLDARLALVDEVRLMSANGTSDTAGTEVVGGSYAAATGVTWTAAASRTASNATAITFTTMPAGDVVGVELWTGGATPVRRWFGSLTTPRTLAAGDDLVFDIGELDVSIS